jgi:fumarate hydratase subunit beta
MKKLSIPIPDEDIRRLKCGDPVSLSGTLITGRDTVHKWMIETFIKKIRQPEGDDVKVYEAIKPLLDGGVIYHCGPVVAGLDTGDYRFVAAGPTTSIREEPYQGDIMRHFNLKAVIGKGVYLHAIGGAASLIAQSVQKVIGVHKLDFGVPEAIWVIEVKDFPVVVTMDAHNNSLHADVYARSKVKLEQLLTM